MVQVAGRIRVLEGCRHDNLPLPELLAAGQPAVLKGLAAGWGVVRSGLHSDAQAMAYLRSFYNGKPVGYSVGEPQKKSFDAGDLFGVRLRDQLFELIEVQHETFGRSEAEPEARP